MNKENHNMNHIIAHRVMFSYRPLTQYYRYKDVFQISPCLDHANIDFTGPQLTPTINPYEKNPIWGPPFPFILQIKLQEEDDPSFCLKKVIPRLDECESLITLLINGIYPRMTNNDIWIPTIRKENDTIKVFYKLEHQGFGLDSPSIDKKFIDILKEISFYIGEVDYYNHLWGQDDKIIVPSTINQNLDLYFKLNDNKRSKFLRACHWYSRSLANKNNDDDLSFISSVIATECLLSNGKPTRKFIEYINKFSSSPFINENSARDLYNKRSRLVHGNFASKIDVDLFNNKTWEELFMLQIATQRSLINWLEDQNRITPRFVRRLFHH